MADKTTTIAQVCAALKSGERGQAISVLKHDYPFAPKEIAKRKYTPLDSTRLFIRDGFIDRYTSQRLTFPPVLRIISKELPAEFPYHPNWKTNVTHPAYWEMCATLDHLEPVSHGGADNESNWVTTSMARNRAKGNWTLAELGWSLQPPGNFSDWDGLSIGSSTTQRTIQNPSLIPGFANGKAARLVPFQLVSHMHYTYVLYSESDREWYTGVTSDLKARVREHAEGRVRSTATRHPLALACYEACLHREDALGRERYLKTGRRTRYLKQRLGQWRVSLSREKLERH